MATVAMSIDLPPSGELEITGDGTSRTQAQMDQEIQARQNFIEAVSPHLKSLPERKPRRPGMSRVPNCRAARSGRSSTITCCSSPWTSEMGQRSGTSGATPQGAHVSYAR